MPLTFAPLNQTRRSAPPRSYNLLSTLRLATRLLSSVVCVSILSTPGATLASPSKPHRRTSVPSSQAIAGKYYRGDGLGYNVSLTLQADGAYSAAWTGCLGEYGKASGQWTLARRKLVFAPTVETGMMRRHLRTLEVLKSNGSWVLVPTETRDRVFYKSWGVSEYSSYQRLPNPSR